MSGYTKGPWRVVWGSLTRYPRSINAGTRRIVNRGAISKASTYEAQCNARLMAAAPELLEALKRIDPQIGWQASMKVVDGQIVRQASDEFMCEFCGAIHLDTGLMEHKPSCAVLAVRTAISKAEGR